MIRWQMSRPSSPSWSPFSYIPRPDRKSGDNNLVHRRLLTAFKRLQCYDRLRFVVRRPAAFFMGFRSSLVPFAVAASLTKFALAISGQI
jgi:hypothetical protein